MDAQSLTFSPNFLLNRGFSAPILWPILFRREQNFPKGRNLGGWVIASFHNATA